MIAGTSFGYSVGSAIAALFAAAYPARVEGVISVERSFTWDDAFGRKSCQSCRSKKSRLSWRMTVQNLKKPASMPQQMAGSVVVITGAPAYLRKRANAKFRGFKTGGMKPRGGSKAVLVSAELNAGEAEGSDNP
ncbi:hypothetical protein DMX04_15670 [Pseudomonas koreensis]|nr:hypothetical protein DMX04_15670 [Pseudomonas koreensis]